MAGNIVKIETAMISRLPQTMSEIWEVGRRLLDISIAELERKGERPELLLAVQAGGRGGAILANLVPSSALPATLADFVLQAMRQPMIGKPRRPQVIRVSSQAEAETLAAMLSAVGVRLEVASELTILDTLQAEMTAALGVGGDYRTQAARAGEPMSDEVLRELFRTAKAFYRAELWRDFADEVLFEITLQLAPGRSKTLYGIVLGSMGEEFGLALYPSLGDFRRFYEVSLQHSDQLLPSRQAVGRGRPRKRQMQQEAELMAEVLSVSAVSLSFTPQRDVPPPLVQEAKQLNLPLASKAAFPLVTRIGEGRMTIGTASDVRDVYAATHAILDWDRRISAMAVDDEIGVTITSQLPAIADLLPAMEVHTTLRLNPYMREEERALPAELDDVLRALFDAPFIQGAAARSKSTRASDGKTAQTRRQKTPTKAAVKSPQIYTLKVYLTGGPVSEAYSGREISRTIQVLGHHTLHDLHQVIFKAFERFDEHLYEFNLGKGPGDRSKLYRYRGGWDDKSTKARDPEATSLASLKLQVGRRFGYTFDMGDDWEHVIDVLAVEEVPTKGRYPRVTAKVGAAPPQYPDEE